MLCALASTGTRQSKTANGTINSSYLPNRNKNMYDFSSFIVLVLRVCHHSSFAFFCRPFDRHRCLCHLAIFATDKNISNMCKYLNNCENVFAFFVHLRLLFSIVVFVVFLLALSNRLACASQSHCKHIRKQCVSKCVKRNTKINFTFICVDRSLVSVIWRRKCCHFVASIRKRKFLLWRCLNDDERHKTTNT